VLNQDARLTSLVPRPKRVDRPFVSGLERGERNLTLKSRVEPVEALA
jgi:hypothetical protein